MNDLLWGPLRFVRRPKNAAQLCYTGPLPLVYQDVLDPDLDKIAPKMGNSQIQVRTDGLPEPGSRFTWRSRDVFRLAEGPLCLWIMVQRCKKRRKTLQNHMSTQLASEHVRFHKGARGAIATGERNAIFCRTLDKSDGFDVVRVKAWARSVGKGLIHFNLTLRRRLDHQEGRSVQIHRLPVSGRLAD